MLEIKKILLGICVLLVVGLVGCRDERGTPNRAEDAVTSGERKAGASVAHSIERNEKRSPNIVSGLGSIDPKTCRAFLVGVDEYETLPPLEYASSDVRKIRDALLEIGLDAKNIRLFVSDGRVRERPSRERILQAFDEMLSETDGEATVLVALSGHGFETTSGAAAFCPEDVVVKNVVVKNKEDGTPVVTPVVTEKTAILMSDVVERLRNDDARFKMLVVDACREPASTARAFGGRPRSFSKFDASGLAFLQSCGSKELSWEHPEVGGVFTHFFCEGLRGAAARDNGGVTFLDACGYASRETQRFVADRRAAEQTPFFTFSGVVDFWLKKPTKATTGTTTEATPSDSVALASKQTFKNDSVVNELPEEYLDANGTVFKLIQAGSFMMGNAGLSPEEIHEKFPKGHLEWIEGATPHKVTLTQPFYMAKYETSVAEFKRFVDATGYVTSAEKEGESWGLSENGAFGPAVGAYWREPKFPQDSTHPVVHISWEDAAAYIDWLNENAEYSAELGCKPLYRLPTEAEWEYACRAGTQTEFFWGTNKPTDGNGYLNGADASGTPNDGTWSGILGDSWLFNDGYVATAPVGSFKPNPLGLHDMAGNVREWCLDWFVSPYDSEVQTDPTGPALGLLRVLRGGSWCLPPVNARSSDRWGSAPYHRSSDFGFRVVVDLRLKTLETEAIATAQLHEEYADANGETFKLIKPDVFTMGNAGLSSEEINEKYPGSHVGWLNEAMRHNVVLTKPFYMAKYETTVAAFEKFVDATGYVTTAEKSGSSWGLREDGGFGPVDGANWRKPTIPQDSTHPVVHISWEDAAAYIDWLNENAEYSAELGCKPLYRLPTEAEWEYACRAGTRTEFFWGTNEPKDGEGYLNAVDESGAPNAGLAKDIWPFNDGYVGLAPVGSFKPNAFGLYDMAGNAMEWCSDRFAPYGSAPQTNPTGPTDGEGRVARGGAWNLGPVSCRSNDRKYFSSNNSSVDRGFRVVVELER
ncbi:MAG: SUMF1/EgtB/PvdO family nonheme iron enzyme [Thermoguttaceae bacterium]|nr:SUMF1/EgtB/PvdO family nonheme iron enzyme [Thermoguttaceae bacterium]